MNSGMWKTYLQLRHAVPLRNASRRLRLFDVDDVSAIRRESVRNSSSSFARLLTLAVLAKQENKVLGINNIR